MSLKGKEYKLKVPLEDLRYDVDIHIPTMFTGKSCFIILNKGHDKDGDFILLKITSMPNNYRALNPRVMKGRRKKRKKGKKK